MMPFHRIIGWRFGLAQPTISTWRLAQVPDEFKTVWPQWLSAASRDPAYQQHQTIFWELLLQLDQASHERGMAAAQLAAQDSDLWLIAAEELALDHPWLVVAGRNAARHELQQVAPGDVVMTWQPPARPC